jgi:hypothetical protein
MARVAVPLLLAFIALLVLIGTQRTRNQELLSSQRNRIGQYQELVDEIYDVAFDAADVDPSSELIIMRINDFKKKELH